MKVEALKMEQLENLKEYCKKHRKELDDSFLYDEDLHNFKIDGENPTYILTDSSGNIKGAASLILDDYHRRGKRARFRIFHSESHDGQYYKQLFEEILKHTKSLDHVFLFVPLLNQKLKDVMEKLKFDVERYTFLLVREDLEVREPSIPEGFEIRSFRPGTDEDAWCMVRNAAFSDLKGSETAITPEMVAKMPSESDYLDGGMMILFENEKPVGVVRGSDDEYEDSPIMNIGPLAILPEYQGKGLGRVLLRAAIQFSKEKGYKRCVLCVNADNEQAKALYLQEGFVEAEGVVCYRYEM
ncbi:GNAT family N-acetyltransferase [Mesobacillus subterraneus]|uniref:GNAT family N-acetyltransferase n=1 Tax=Mesobacillus subterraneus TaxID=285983 RepID=UPI00203A6AD6|nr:GNAT family N-acetyltransferase [Mesobacillus subterraneus]MCM3665071.1 GNAT family N-acetyltransferase [Mesobacillus subterraneus]MCM3684085.1 GNAT family N-acetyltransferase [Mesobacillus subterraneus]